MISSDIPSEADPASNNGSGISMQDDTIQMGPVLRACAHEALGDPETIEDNLSVDEIIQKHVSKNVRDLGVFFSSNNFITEKGNQLTNVINVSEKKTYNVPDTHIEPLFQILEGCRKESRMLHYSERQETSTLKGS